MKIEDASVRLDASHEYDYRYQNEISSQFSFRSAMQQAETRGNQPANTQAGPVTEASETNPTKPSREEAVRIRLMMQQLIASILNLLGGEKCRCRVDDIADLQQGLPAEGLSADRAPGVARQAMEFTWERRVVERIDEREATDFSAKGTVKTADGREIDFALDLAMCRQFSCTREQLETGKAVFKDPLVINYAGKAAELTDARFNFDLDADGADESLPILGKGSGYLVFDANGDGCIKDGRELFGATGEYAGNGFADLAAHDADRNGWIDEADPVFAALGVWFPDGRITPLKATGVGALNLASADTPFALRDVNNAALGQVWRSGVYLNENGSAGTLQQIDLGVKPATGATAV